MANRFNGGRGAITCDGDHHSGRMIAEGVRFADEPPYLHVAPPRKVYQPDAVWIVGDDGRVEHYCSIACVGPLKKLWPLFDLNENKEPRS